MMLVAAGLMTGCGKDSEETPTKPEDPGDPIPPVTTTYEIGDYYENGFVKGIVIYIGKTGADWDSAPEQSGTLLMRQS